MARDFIFDDSPKLGSPNIRPTSSTPKTDWGDWKYRLLVELHRRERINAHEAAGIVGVSEDRVERYLDDLEGEGKVQQMGDAERGVFYKIVNEA